jgi:preprotein translocase subunit SecG
MTKLTTLAAVIFMLTSLSLAYFYSHREYVIKTVPKSGKVEEKTQEGKR